MNLQRLIAICAELKSARTLAVARGNLHRRCALWNGVATAFLALAGDLAVSNPAAAENLAAGIPELRAQLDLHVLKPTAETDAFMTRIRHHVEHPPVGFQEELAWFSTGLAQYYRGQARFVDALHFADDAYKKWRALNAGHVQVANCLNSLAFLSKEMGQYPLAISNFEGAKELLADRTDVDGRKVYAQVLNNLGKVHFVMGAYAQAEPAYAQALKIRDELARSVPAAGLPDVLPYKAETLNNYATLRYQQRRFDDAQKMYDEALALFRRFNDRRSQNGVADVLENLGTLNRAQGKLLAADAWFAEALTARRNTVGEDHPYTARTMFQMARLRIAQGRAEDAERLLDSAYDVRRRILGPMHPDTAAVLVEQAKLLGKQGRTQEALKKIDDAIRIQGQGKAAYGQRYESHVFRGQLLWSLELKGEALDDIHAAMDFAEKQREDTAGAEREMAAEFAEFRTAFDLAIAWHSQENQTGEVFYAMERSRSRALLDQIGANAMKIDEDAARQASPQMIAAETGIRAEIAEIRAGLKRASDAEVESLRRRLGQREAELAVLIEGRRSQHRAWRYLIEDQIQNTRLGELQRELGRDDKLLLMYAVAENESYVLAVDAEHKPVLSKLAVDDDAARALEIASGSLSRAALSACMRNSGGRVSLSLQTPEPGTAHDRILHSCYRILFPQAVLDLLAAHPYRGITIIPDGPLGAIPFEALVVKYDDAGRQYLIEVAPPLEYAPSVAVWRRMADRRLASAEVGRGVVTLGDPAYKLAGPPQPVEQVAVRGQDHTRLPYSGVESNGVFDAFQARSESVTRLLGKEATEAQLRQHIERKRIIHLACHGFVDDRFGNLFGHLALAPGAANQLHDDGELTLDEIYHLHLDGCEVAVLSACHTNSSPEGTGEGTWGLSHGFVVAGAARVVASNWLVDDQAASNLVVRYLEDVAGRSGGEFRHAAALRDAKLALFKAKPEWRAPYYWAPFVLLGSD